MGDNALINQYRPLLKSWTPTITVGAGTWTGQTIYSSSYFMLGRLCFFALDIGGTLSSGANTKIQFTLPVQPVSVSGYNSLNISYLDLAGVLETAAGFYFTYGSAIEGNISRNTVAAFPAGALRFIANGIFLAAETA